MQQLPHIVPGDFDENTYFKVDVLPLLEQARQKCTNRGIPLMWIAQTASSADRACEITGGCSSDCHNGMHQAFSNTVFAAMMLFGQPDLPACVQMIQNACRAKLQCLNEIRKQFAKRQQH